MSTYFRKIKIQCQECRQLVPLDDQGRMMAHTATPVARDWCEMAGKKPGYIHVNTESLGGQNGRPGQ